MSRFCWIFFLIIFAASCNEKEDNKEDVLLQYGDHKLTKEEVEDMIPKGISKKDSANLFNSIVYGWLKEVVLSDFAEEQLYDTGSIDRKVRNYRNSLIVQEYLSRMQESHTPKIDEDKIKDYYDLHRNELKLEVPLVKGIFMKFNNGIENREELRKLFSTDNPENIDILEQEWMDKSLEYNYFRDKWMDWETLSYLIPYRFEDPDRFLKDNKYFEVEFGDCIYFLQVSDYILCGDIQPYDYARTWIENVLTQGSLADYERVLVNSLINEALKDDKLQMIGYDPIKYEIIQKNDLK